MRHLAFDTRSNTMVRSWNLTAGYGCELLVPFVSNTRKAKVGSESWNVTGFAGK